MGIFGKDMYRRTLKAPGAPGTRSRASGYNHRPSAINPLLAQNLTITVGGTAADGVYSYRVVDPDGNETLVEFDRQDSETNTAIAAALRDRHNAISPVDDYFEATSAAAVETLTGKMPGTVFTVEAVDVPGGATLVVAETQASGGFDIAPGRFVARKSAGDPSLGTSDEIRNLTGTDELADIWGAVEQYSIPREIGEDGTVDRNIKPGETAAPMTVGYMWVTSETAIATTDSVYVRLTAGAGEIAGTIRADADGGDAIDASTKVRVITGTTEAGGTAEVSIDLGP